MLLLRVTFLNRQTLLVLPRWHQTVYRFQDIQIAWTREHYRFHLRRSCKLKSHFKVLHFQRMLSSIKATLVWICHPGCGGNQIVYYEAVFKREDITESRVERSYFLVLQLYSLSHVTLRGTFTCLTRFLSFHVCRVCLPPGNKQPAGYIKLAL